MFSKYSQLIFLLTKYTLFAAHNFLALQRSKMTFTHCPYVYLIFYRSSITQCMTQYIYTRICIVQITHIHSGIKLHFINCFAPIHHSTNIVPKFRRKKTKRKNANCLDNNLYVCMCHACMPRKVIHCMT